MTDWANLDFFASELVTTARTNQSECLPTSDKQQNQTGEKSKQAENPSKMNGYKADKAKQETNCLNSRTNADKLSFSDFVAADDFWLWAW